MSFDADGGSADQPPSGWTAAEWAALTPQEQAAELQTQQDIASAKSGAVTPDVDALNAVIDNLMVAPTPDDQPLEGVSDARESPISRAKFAVTNQWRDVSADRTRVIEIYAGVRAENPDVGVLLVRTIDDYLTDSRRTDMTFYTPPSATADLHIAGVSNGDVSLASSGFVGTFDVSARTFNRATCVQ